MNADQDIERHDIGQQDRWTVDKVLARLGMAAAGATLGLIAGVLVGLVTGLIEFTC